MRHSHNIRQQAIEVRVSIAWLQAHLYKNYIAPDKQQESQGLESY